MIWLNLLAILGGLTYSAYLHVSLMLDLSRWLKPGRKFPLFTAIRMETKPFRYVGVILLYLPDVVSGRMSFWDMFWFAVGLIACHVTRNDEDDDDRWKRRRKALSAKVAQVGGRLQVVPAEVGT